MLRSAILSHYNICWIGGLQGIYLGLCWRKEQQQFKHHCTWGIWILILGVHPNNIYQYSLLGQIWRGVLVWLYQLGFWIHCSPNDQLSILWWYTDSKWLCSPIMLEPGWRNRWCQNRLLYQPKQWLYSKESDVQRKSSIYLQIRYVHKPLLVCDLWHAKLSHH